MATLIQQLTPKVVAMMESGKEAIIASSGTMVDRVALRMAWPMAMDLLPTVLDRCYKALLSEIGTRSISDVTRELLDDYQSMVHAEQQKPL